jgi:hypothetical protein
MKKVLFLFGFFALTAVWSLNAQSCSSASAGKSCCSGKAAKAASVDATIEKRMDDKGEVSYVRKETDVQGNVKFVSVRYDEGSNTFVNVAPKTVTAEAKASGMVKKECATEAKACAKGAEGKTGCCKKAEGTAAKSCAGESGTNQ